MKPIFSAAIALSLLAAPVYAGDVAAGEKTYSKCKACHSIVDADGNAIVKGGKTGPNLYGVIGRAVGGAEDFKYGTGLAAANEAGLVWDEEMLAAYVVDPKAWVQEATGDDKAKSKMTFKLKKGGEDIAAYLASLGG